MSKPAEPRHWSQRVTATSNALDLEPERRQVLERAKTELRILYGRSGGGA